MACLAQRLVFLLSKLSMKMSNYAVVYRYRDGLLATLSIISLLKSQFSPVVKCGYQNSRVDSW